MTAYPAKMGIFDFGATNGDTKRVGVNSTSTSSTTMNQLAFWDRIATAPYLRRTVNDLG